jgi:ABC-type antimicrobial peptide transport system permease subunit
MGFAGVAAGAAGGYLLVRLVGSYFQLAEMPGVTPLAGAAAVLVAAAVVASVLPALRASRVDVIQALRSE